MKGLLSMRESRNSSVEYESLQWQKAHIYFQKHGELLAKNIQ